MAPCRLRLSPGSIANGIFRHLFTGGLPGPACYFGLGRFERFTFTHGILNPMTSIIYQVRTHGVLALTDAPLTFAARSKLYLCNAWLYQRNVGSSSTAGIDLRLGPQPNSVARSNITPLPPEWVTLSGSSPESGEQAPQVQRGIAESLFPLVV